MKNILAAISKLASGVISISGMRQGISALLAAKTNAVCPGPVLCIVPSEEQTESFSRDLGLFTDTPVHIYPGYDIPPYTPLSPDPATVAARISTLYQALSSSSPFIMVASCEALLRKVLPKELLDRKTELLIAGEETDQKELVNRLVAAGYEPVSLVQEAGEFSVRGGIMDIFSPGFDLPARLDFFGDTVESIRLFDPVSQRSVEDIHEIILLPACDILYAADTRGNQKIYDTFAQLAEQRDWDFDQSRKILERIETRKHFPGIEFFMPLFYENPVSPLDYLPDTAKIFMVNPHDISRTIHLTWERIETNLLEAQSHRNPVFPSGDLFLSEKELSSTLSRFPLITMSDLSISEPDGIGQSFHLQSGNHTLIKQDLELKRKEFGLLTPLVQQIDSWLEEGGRAFLACRSNRRAQQLGEMLREHGLDNEIKGPPFDFSDQPRNRGIILYTHPLSEGFDLVAEQVHLLSENELFGEKRIGPKGRTRKTSENSALQFEELQHGEVIVHKDHGLGLYEGLINMELRGVTNDFMQISFQGNDRLYVPVDRLSAITKYKGVSDKEPKLDRLGSKIWATTKNKIKKAVWKIALDLLDLYARRAMNTGKQFSTPDELYYELEESFPYDETPGQIKAINDVIADLTSEKTMDRLVCGDVGYGKTEVAIRAAFKVVEDSHQVAILVPTTVLADQHAATFAERLKGFPVNIKSLNRFRTAGEQKKIIKGLADGSVDIVIGTHRLLSKDIKFRKLGLLIIDEEHRFGVTHKEKLKKLKSSVDVLTLTATPIPRTLQFSLLGIRDLSVISSPPAHRRTVKTFIAKHDDLVIKEAVTKELLRRGQVFIVHNRVHSIHDMAKKVQKLVPEAKIAVAHGQMPGKNLEEIMVRFVNREIDVLVCTTIIESGLDIPNANTIIITSADRLGLAEIYQLRGRVGRSNEQAYAYLMVPSLDGLSKDATQRLRALMDYNELGGGFKLAMTDLQIRGGGNILGESQSGTIAAVGYDLYLDLLQKTVADLKRKAELGDDFVETEDIDPEINLAVSAYFPERYIHDANQRYIAYRKITSIGSDEDLADYKNELEDRYGLMPMEVSNLFEVISLKRDLKKFMVIKLDQGASTIVMAFHDQTPVDPQKILLFINKSNNKARFTPDNRLVCPYKPDSKTDIFETVRNILQNIG